MFGNTRRRSPEHLEALARIERWTRSRFGLRGKEVVSVSQVECRLPGCAPLETVVQFWTADGTRHHFKVFKPAVAVEEGDLPFSWMKQALAEAGALACDCC